MWHDAHKSTARYSPEDITHPEYSVIWAYLETWDFVLIRNSSLSI